MAYITNAGFDKPTLPEMVQQIGDAMETVVGPVNRQADSSTGQWIGIEAEQNAVHFEALEQLWASRFLAGAEGFALDALGDWMGGITRRQQTPTRVNAVIYGTESALVPAGSLASYGSNQFRLTEDSVVTRSELLDGQFRITSSAQAVYTVRIAGVDFSYTKLNGDNVNTIAAGISAVVDATSQYSSSANGSVVNLTSENLVEGYAVSVSSGMVWQRIGSPAVFEATDSGPIEVPVGALNNPVSAIAGWTGVNNFVQGATGNNRESDAEYRARLESSRRAAGGAATVDAIESRLLNEVEGVTIAVVLENDTMTEVNGIPPKSIHTIVSGGLEQNVADALWKYKGAGIETYGDLSITVYDRHSRPHLVRFSRPTPLAIYVRVDVVLLDSEEQLPPAVVDAIKQGVINYSRTLSLGDDVITQRIYGHIYANTSGIGKMTITASTDGSNFSEDNISIPDNTYATFSADNVEVTGV